ncbi:SGNH/GDSL hydrolase family protein [Phytohabitans rumicis]|uniref:SGNH/GDSL hydrolase family protein n=1 Tax=Phytohabitans rumicis TaxID=1076125 RepID=UPI00280B8A53|nr:SGNH/GDSL hydrolase family protein [Phytohabitans rumicis]
MAPRRSRRRSRSSSYIDRRDSLAGVRTVRVTAVLALLATATLVPGTAQATTTPSLLSTVHTAGRVEVDAGTARFSWPGVYFEGRFRGTGIGVVLDDPAADYDVQVDGATVATLVTPAAGTHWVTGLAGGRHTVRLVKRSESPWATSAFGGFVAAPGGAILGKPTPRSRQIEFIGDSYTAGYGNLSASRDCTGDEVNRTTNADLSFGALAAKRLNADYQINAFSGRGMVRNYNGGEPGTSYRTYYDRALLAVDGDVWPKPRNWRPQVVVVGLGINDFSTAINPGEPWTQQGLLDAYRTAYHGFLDKLRARYGPRTVIVVSATYVYNTTALADSAQQVVQERGDDRIRYWYYSNEGLDYLGCHWHPSLHDHQAIADRLTTYLATLPSLVTPPPLIPSPRPLRLPAPPPSIKGKRSWIGDQSTTICP